MGRYIKTAKADERARARRATADTLPARLTALPGKLREVGKMRGAYDTRPISRQEWNAVAGDAASLTAG